MRKFVIMRGPQGSAKSWIVEQTGLGRHTVSLDAIREAIFGAVLGPHGQFTVNNESNKVVWAMAMDSLNNRMRRGETIAFDATNPIASDVRNLAKKAEEWGYEVLVVDRFGDNPEAAFARNLSRAQHKQVSRKSFDRVLNENAKSGPLKGMFEVLAAGSDIAASVEGVVEFLKRGTAPRDLSHYDRIVHFSDLQGCLSPLLASASPVMRWLDDPKTFFVFHGDLLDRGIENGDVLRWWLQNMIGRPNLVSIAGNHEDHIEIEARGEPSVSKEFARRTLPQLVDAGISREDLKVIARSFVSVLPYWWRGNLVLASHAGFPCWPEPLHFVPDAQFRRGTGFYQSPVDKSWSSWAESTAADHLLGPDSTKPRAVWQVHGHRNSAMLPVIAGSRSINLEGQVEFGGHLRFAVLDEAGWTPTEIRNRHHRTMQEFRMIDADEGREPHDIQVPIAPWAARGITSARPIPAEKLERFTSSPLVFVHPSETRPHIAALNFNKTAFYEKLWDELTIHTRGLFVNMETGVIAARSYPKTFNHGERPETQDEALATDLSFPVSGYVKENGFLGITGFDDVNGDLIIASKSRTEGPFAEWFRTILTDSLGPVGMERLLRVNRDQVASCVFEVIDPVNDPHIIKEAKPRVVLLDVIHRADEFETMPYADLLRMGEFLGCDVKRLAFKNIQNWDVLSRLLDRIRSDQTWRPNRGGEQVEGVMVADAAGFQFKQKAAFYRFWKRMRSAKERIALCRRKGIPFEIKRYENDAEALAFVEFCMRQPPDVLERDIVALRDAYLADPSAVLPSALPAMEEVPPDQAGFLRGVDAIAAQLDAGTAKPDTVRRLLQRAGEDPYRQEAFNSHPAAERLRAFADALPAAA